MSSKKTILVVDDEPNIRRILQVSFEKAGHRVLVAEHVDAALAQIGESVDCVLSDVMMPGRSGYDLLRTLRDEHPDIPVVIMTAFGTIPQAVQAIRDGAFEYVPKPFDLEQLRKVVAAAMEIGCEQKPVGRAPKSRTPASIEFIAESPAMKEVVETIRQVADSRANILIAGESGTGKEVVAKLAHHLSSRAKGPFVAVSCAAIPESLMESELFGYEKGAFTGANGAKAGKFEAGSGGTLFLDEIGEVPLPVQVKLLRVLQERVIERLGSNKPTKIDARLVAATNRNLQRAVEEGIFRLDLLYRLQVVEIALPALRERPEDIVPLARHFLAKFGRENGRSALEVSPEAEERLLSYPWPGNVRELENTMERAVVLSREDETSLTARHLPHTLRTAA